MTPQTIDVQPLDVRAGVGEVNDDARTVELTFSTGAGVMRFDWMSGKRYLEVLSMDPAHVRLDRLNAGAPLLDSHSAYSIAHQIGVVEPNTATLKGKEGRATVRFSKRADVEPFYQDVRDKIIRNVSVGYRVHKFEESQGKDGSITRKAIDWEPFEISMVPMGADAGARVRGSKDVDTNPCVIVRNHRTATVSDEDRSRHFRLARAHDPALRVRFASDVQTAVKWLKKAIARHERHMAGTEDTSDASQKRMMAEMMSALAALDDDNAAM